MLESEPQTAAASLAGRRAASASAVTQAEAIGNSTVPARRLRAERPNQVWVLDFIFDPTADGRGVKVRSMGDEFTRKSVGGRLARFITP